MLAATSAIRTWVMPTAFGAVAAYLLVELWAFASAKLQPTYWLWKQLQIAPRDLPFDVNTLFDAAFGILFGAAVSCLLVQLVRGSLLRAWVLFAVGCMMPFVVPTFLSLPDAPELSLVISVLHYPLFWCFAISSLVIFYLHNRRTVNATLP